MFTIAEISGGRLSPPFMPTKTKPHILGRLIEFEDDKTEFLTDTVEFEYDVELLSLSVGVSQYYPEDFWNMRVGEEKIFETIYTKDLPEGAYLMAVVPIRAGTPLVFEYANMEMVEKYVWYNYQFLR